MEDSYWARVEQLADTYLKETRGNLFRQLDHEHWIQDKADKVLEWSNNPDIHDSKWARLDGDGTKVEAKEAMYADIVDKADRMSAEDYDSGIEAVLDGTDWEKYRNMLITPCGCTIEKDGTCPHGTTSILRKKGLI